jgi:hypothetical protein
MPGTTPNFAIPYPCPGDPIDCNDFEAWAGAIDDALTTVNEAATAAANRPRAMLRTPDAGVSVPVGVSTQILFSDTVSPVYNNGLDLGTAPLYSGFRVFPPLETAFYLFTATFIPLNTVTSVTSFRATMTLDNISVGRVMASSVAATSSQPITLVGIGVLDAADPTSFGICSYLWTGSGGPMNVHVQFSCQYVSRFTQ